MRNECDLQHLILQLFSAFFFPTQFSPPFSGTGLSHFRVLICFPFVLGHLALHFDHLLHFPQPPSTKRMLIISKLSKNVVIQKIFRYHIFKFLDLLLYLLAVTQASQLTPPQSTSVSSLSCTELLQCSVLTEKFLNQT